MVLEILNKTNQGAKLTSEERKQKSQVYSKKVETLEQNLQILNLVHGGLCELLFLYLSSLQNCQAETDIKGQKSTPAVYIFSVLKSVLQNVRINPKNLRIKSNQPLIAKKLNKFYNDPMNQTSKKWNIFVDACTEYISRFFKMDALKTLLEGEKSLTELEKVENKSSLNFVGHKFKIFEDFFLIAPELKSEKNSKKKKKNSANFEKFISTRYLTQTTSILTSI